MDNGLLGAGLSMIFFQTEYHCQISIENLITMENLGQYSGLFFALEYCNREHISIHINGANCSHNNRDAVSLLVWKNDDLLCTTRRNFLGAMHSIMNISNAYFSKNLGVLSFKSTYIYQFDSAIRLVNITVVDNTSPLDLINVISVVLEHVNVTGNAGIVMDIKRSSITLEGNITFQHNRGAYWSVSYFLNSTATFRGNTTLVHNVGFRAGAIYAQHSILLFQGNVTFAENYGDMGGAMALYKHSIIGLGQHAKIRFIENHAQRFGGALYVNEANDYQWFRRLNK